MMKILILILLIQLLIILNCNSETICFSNERAEKVKKIIMLYPEMQTQVLIQDEIISNQKTVISNIENQKLELSNEIQDVKKESKTAKNWNLALLFSYIPFSILLIVFIIL
jgi:hypothetical protein